MDIDVSALLLAPYGGVRSKEESHSSEQYKKTIKNNETMYSD